MRKAVLYSSSGNFLRTWVGEGLEALSSGAGNEGIKFTLYSHKDKRPVYVATVVLGGGTLVIEPVDEDKT